MRSNNFEVWRNTKSAFSGMKATADDLDWHIVIAFLSIFGLSELSAFLTLYFYGGEFVNATLSAAGQLQYVLFDLVWCLVLAPYGIAIHRQVLLSEKPSMGYFSALIGKRSLRFAVAGFFFSSLSITFPMWMIAASGYNDTLPTYFLYIAFIWMVLGGVVFARICVLFPAIAVDAQIQKVGAAWHATRRNTYRIWLGFFGIYLACLIPYLILNKLWLSHN